MAVMQVEKRSARPGLNPYWMDDVALTSVEIRRARGLPLPPRARRRTRAPRPGRR
jgi:hypothetical protein